MTSVSLTQLMFPHPTTLQDTLETSSILQLPDWTLSGSLLLSDWTLPGLMLLPLQWL